MDSLGGMIALEMASRASTRITSLCLIVTTHKFTSLFRGSFHNLGAALTPLLRRFRSYERQIDDLVTLLYPTPFLDLPLEPSTVTEKGSTPRTNREAVTADMVEKVGPVDNDIAKRQIKAILTHSVSSKRLRAISDVGYPILLVAAQQDRLIHVGCSHRLARKLTSPHTQLVTFEDAGHGVMHQKRHAVTSHLIRHLLQCPHDSVQVKKNP